LSNDNYPMEMVATGGPGNCSGDAFGTGAVSTSGDGRGTADPSTGLTWWISQNCSGTRMTVSIEGKVRRTDGSARVWTGSVVLP
jgi:hypothetical protein